MKKILCRNGVLKKYPMKNTPILNGRTALYLASLLTLMLFSMGVNAQVNQQENIIRDWKMLYSDADNLGMSYRIVSCNDEVFLMLKMSSLKDDIATQEFQLQVINPSTGDRISRNISLVLEGRKQISAQCGESLFPELKIILPPSYKPESVYVAVSF